MMKKYILAAICVLTGVIVPATPVAAEDEVTPVSTPRINEQFYLSPWEGYRGTYVWITGSAFTKNTVVKFYFSSDVAGVGAEIGNKITAYKYLGSVWTTPGGMIDNSVASGNLAVYQVPARLDDGSDKKNTPGGTSYFYATYSNSNRVIALEKFTVTSPAKLTVSPDSGLVGDSITLTGNLFAAGEKLTAKYDDREIAITTGNLTTARGDASTTLFIPDSTFGKHIISLTDETGNYAADDFNVDTRITVNPTVQSISGTISVGGTGFSSRKPVSISINGREVTPTESPLSTTQYGSFKATISVPFDFAYINGGKAVISATTGSSAANAEIAIPATPPDIKILPETSANNPASIGTVIKIEGKWFEPGDLVKIFFDDGKDPAATATVNNNNAFFVEVTIPPLKGGPHSLGAVGNRTNARAQIYIEFTVLAQPVLKSASVAGGANTAIRLSWSSVSGPAGIKYVLQIAADRNFSDILVEKVGLTAAEYTLTAAESEKLNRGGDPCYWRVKAIDGAGNDSGWTASLSLITDHSWLNLPGWTMYLFISLGALVVLLFAFIFFRKKTAASKSFGTM